MGQGVCSSGGAERFSTRGGTKQLDDAMRERRGVAVGD